jgi:hypothetical protein
MNMNKEKPIIFSTPMVKAILEGRKTQTRRVIKPQPDDGGVHGVTVEGFQTALYQAEEYWINTEEGESKQVKPRYRKGDILWVREKFCNVNRPEVTEYYYFADTLFVECEDYDPKEWTWKTSLYMPRKAARLFLKVTSVRVERLQDISEKDAEAEGIKIHQCEMSNSYREHCRFYVCSACEHQTLRGGYSKLWDSLNAKCGYSWESNPWVWVYEFVG